MTQLPVFSKNRFLLLVAALFLLLSTGCLYSNVRLPLDTDVTNTELGPKVGESSWQSVLGLVAWGDASTSAAASNGDIQKITHLDVQRKIILFGAYHKSTTIAYGE